MKFNRAALVTALDAAIAAAVQRNQVVRTRNAEAVEQNYAEFMARAVPGWEQFAANIQAAVAEGRVPTKDDIPEAIKTRGYRDIEWEVRPSRPERLPVNTDDIARWVRLAELLRMSNDPEVTTTGLRDLGFKGENAMLMRILAESTGEAVPA